ncbi:aminotransferase class V-fold PLP-dependent enzyme [Agromyces sp. SYSU T00194]|uniref:aminotransferase class V-fold PLP-dependent enzyme n=1 Tax=Agromyces chitinivorans TaxID=3158560 RepID=UPI003395E303
MTSAPLTEAELDGIRAQFPILRTEMHGHPLAYLDSAATAQKPLRVLDAERAFSAEANAAVHRGAHTLAAEATERYEEARATVARHLGAPEHEVVFTGNATEGLNLLATAIGHASTGRGAGADFPRHALVPGDEIVATELEHHANLIPWQELAARTGARLRIVPVDDDGVIDADAAADVITDRTRILAVAHVSNVTGRVSPLEALVPLARAVGALVVLDACQSAPHLELRPAELGVDAAVFSAHKVYGPTGIGVVWGRRELLDALPPHLYGGSAITTVTLEKAEFLPAPQRFEPGTPRMAQAIGLAEALHFVDEVGLERIAATEHALAARLHDGLADMPGIRVLGGTGAEGRVAVASIDVTGVHAHDAGQVLDDLGIAVRVGHHCAQPLHRRLGLSASLRISAGVYTTPAEIDRALDAVSGIRGFFGVESAA